MTDIPYSNSQPSVKTTYRALLYFPRRNWELTPTSFISYYVLTYVSRPAVLAASEDLLEMKFSEPIPDLLNQKLGRRPSDSCFNEPLGNSAVRYSLQLTVLGKAEGQSPHAGALGPKIRSSVIIQTLTLVSVLMLPQDPVLPFI